MKQNTESSTLLDIYESSLKIIKDNQSVSGAFIASPNFGEYAYSWFRDGAFISNALVMAGEIESAGKFHGWAAHVVSERAAKIQSLIERHQNGEEIQAEEHLDCRYTLNGEEGIEPWTNLQLDGFGTWLWSLDEFRKVAGALDDNVRMAADLIAEYISEFWEIESFDWWEESFGHQHVSSLGSIATGLDRHSQWESVSPGPRSISRREASRIKDLISQRGIANGRLTKWIGGQGLDASLLAIFEPFELFEVRSNIAQSTIAAISSQLGIHGTYRHVDDDYFGGGRWPLLSCFLGLCYAELGDLTGATDILRWVASTANATNELPEQIDGELLHPANRQLWIDRWGEPAVPLLWNHAMFIQLYETLRRFGVDL
jgi:GH15 family glucan-1,4-alpha-glucosidase